MPNIFMYVSISFIIIGGLYSTITINSLKEDVKTKKYELMQKEVKLTKKDSESQECQQVVQRQNQSLRWLKSSKQQALEDLQKWKVKPAKIKYKTIYKIREVRSNECKDTKDVLDAVRGLDFNLL